MHSTWCDIHVFVFITSSVIKEYMNNHDYFPHLLLSKTNLVIFCKIFYVIPLSLSDEEILNRQALRPKILIELKNIRPEIIHQ